MGTTAQSVAAAAGQQCNTTQHTKEQSTAQSGATRSNTEQRQACNMLCLLIATKHAKGGLRRTCIPRHTFLWMACSVLAFRYIHFLSLPKGKDHTHSGSQDAHVVVQGLLDVHKDCEGIIGNAHLRASSHVFKMRVYVANLYFLTG